MILVLLGVLETYKKRVAVEFLRNFTGIDFVSFADLARLYLSNLKYRNVVFFETLRKMLEVVNITRTTGIEPIHMVLKTTVLPLNYVP